MIDNDYLNRLSGIWRGVDKNLNLKPPARPPIQNLVLEGGGAKGISYCGVISELESNGLLGSLKRVAGSSAGGIIATLLAVGYNPSEIRDILEHELDLKNLMDSRNKVDPTRLFKIAGMKFGISDLVMLFKHKGLYKGDAFQALSKMLIERKLKEGLSAHIRNQHANELDLIQKDGLKKGKTQTEIDRIAKQFVESKYNKILDKHYISNLGEITFDQLNALSTTYPSLNIKELYLTGTRLSDASLKVFSAQTDGAMPVCDALRITMSFPFGFEPVQYQGDYFADGGIANNYPMQIFDAPEFQEYGLNHANANPCTLGVLVDSQVEIDQRWGISSKSTNEKLKLSDLVHGIVRGLHNRLDVLRERYDVNSIQVFDEEIETMDLELGPEKIGKLVRSGQKAALEYLDNYYGNTVTYNSLPDYSSVAEKYYSKTMPELNRILFEELMPLWKEVQIFLSIGHTNLLAEFEQRLAELDPEVVKIQEEIYEQMQILADEMESLESQLGWLQEKYKELERDERQFNRELEVMLGHEHSPEAVGEKHQKREAINLQRELLKVQMAAISKKMNQGKETYQKCRQQVNPDIYSIIERKHYCKMVIDNHLEEKMVAVMNNINKEMDVVLDIMRQNRSDIADPREGTEQENRIAANYDTLFSYYYDINITRQMNPTQAKESAQDSVQLVQDYMMFGANLNEAKEMHQRYILMLKLYPADEVRIRLWSSFLIDKLIQKDLISDDVNEIMLIKEFYRDQLLKKISDHANMPRAHLECAVQNEVTKKCKLMKQVKANQVRRKAGIVQDDKNESIKKFEYASELSKASKELAEGNWRDFIQLSSKEDVEHNLKHMYEKNKQTYGKHSSGYSITPVKSKAKKGQKSQIKANILVPDLAKVQNEKFPIKEVVVVFNDPAAKLKNYQLTYAYKNYKERKKHFDSMRQELMQQIIWTIRKMKESNINPPDAKIALTIYGEGIAGQDAQYLFAETLAHMRRSQNTELRDIANIELILKDPVRVEQKVAEQAAADLESLAAQNSAPHVTGYQQVHRKLHRRKAINYLNECNVLSLLNPKHARVNVDVRSTYDHTYQYEMISNRDSEKARLYLNRRNWVYTTHSFRYVNLLLKKTTQAGRFVFTKLFPTVGKLLIKALMFAPAQIIKRLGSPLIRLARLFKKKKVFKPVATPWSNQLEQITESARSSLTRSDFSLSSKPKPRTLMRRLDEYIERAQPSKRLNRSTRPPIENMVFEGGGVKGTAYVGAIQEMETNGMLANVKRYAGSSAGGITAALLALGYTGSELNHLFSNVIDFKEFMDEPLSLGGIDSLIEVSGMEIGVTSLISLFKNKGLYRGDKFVELMGHLTKVKLEQKIKQMMFDKLSPADLEGILLGVDRSDKLLVDKMIESYLNAKILDFIAELNIDDLRKITLGQLKMLAEKYPELNLKELYLTGTNVSDASLQVFSADADPDMPLVDAVRITMSFPGGFMPVQYKGKYYVDGGVANNYPVQIFDKPEFLTHGVNDAGVNPCTLGFLIDSKEEIEARWGINNSKIKDLNLMKFIGSVLAGISNRSEVLKDKYNINSIQIVDNVGTDENYVPQQTMDLNMSKAAKEKLVDNGRREVQQFYANYLTTDVIYHPSEQFDNLMQKYYGRSVLELKKILKEEVDPLIQEYMQLEGPLLKFMKNEQERIESLNHQLHDYPDLEGIIRNVKPLEHEEELIQKEISKLHAQNEHHKHALQLMQQKITPVDHVGKQAFKNEIDKLQKLINHNDNTLNALQQKKEALTNKRTALMQRCVGIDHQMIQLAYQRYQLDLQLMRCEQFVEIKQLLMQERSVILKALQSKGETVQETVTGRREPMTYNRESKAKDRLSTPNENIADKQPTLRTKRDL